MRRRKLFEFDGTVGLKLDVEREPSQEIDAKKRGGPFSDDGFVRSSAIHGTHRPTAVGEYDRLRPKLRKPKRIDPRRREDQSSIEPGIDDRLESPCAVGAADFERKDWLAVLRQESSRHCYSSSRGRPPK